MSLEVIIIPVTNVDKAKEFYQDKLGFKTDMDVKPTAGMRLVQLTPPGSGCSIHIGQGITDMTPGSLKGMILVVDSAEQARKELEDKGVELGETQEMPWGKHIAVADPDGNSWTLQESYARNRKN
jgi:catechol 2,3-dioxygenase-like lactoylglutathione lyase family enzyme